MGLLGGMGGGMHVAACECMGGWGCRGTWVGGAAGGQLPGDMHEGCR